MEKLKSNITTYWPILSYLILAIFLLGGIYAEFKFHDQKLETVKQRLDKKIKIQEDLEDKIIEIEKWILIQETKEKINKGEKN